MINWKEAFSKAAIFGGIAFLSALQAVGVDQLFVDPKPAIVSALIVGGIAFLTSLKDVFVPPIPDTPPA